MYGKYFSTYALVNDALRTYAYSHPNCFYVTAQGLTANPDGLHFNALSLRSLGIRYYQAYQQLAHVLEPPPNEIKKLTSIYDRPLTKREKTFQLETSFATGKIGIEEFQRELVTLQGSSVA